jgi:UDP-2,3-diacylglucosamine pyrophosphatase LpxH
MSYIVVSDVHLGSKLCNFDQFCSFLEWLLDLKDSPKMIPSKDGMIEIKSPEKMVLLGDILELWDPMEGDRDHVVKQCLRPLSLLSNLSCDKVYVMGNHDDAIKNYNEKIDYEMFRNYTKLDIWNRHYPDEDAGMKIGGRSYFFLHGHQYDKSQAILAMVSKLLGETWDPVEWCNSQYNTSFTKRHWASSFLLFAVSVSALVAGWYIQSRMFESFESSFAFTVLGVLVGVLVGGFFAFSSLPAIVTKGQRKIYNLSKPKDKTARQILEDEYYKEQKDTVTADVVVFGHTHFASSYRGSRGGWGKEKIFVNTGSWVGVDEDIDGEMRYSNTFVYIDDGGAHILRWNDGNPELIESL